MTEVRPFRCDEWLLLRQTRLAALHDAPAAFAARLDEEERLPDGHWHALARAEGRFAGSRSVLAARAGDIVGMAGCYPETRRRYRLVSMWVAPEGRGIGVGGLILRTVEDWVVRQEASELVAAAFLGNSTAVRFYHAQGFEEVSRGPFVDAAGTRRTELQLRKPLAAQQA